MSRLFNPAPCELDVAGVKYDINPGYRTILRIMEVSRHDDLEQDQKALYLIYKLFPHLQNEPIYSLRLMPEEQLAAYMEAAVWFIRCGRGEKEEYKRPLVDFQKDEEYIDNAFLAKNVDLAEKTDLHWWRFIGHFSELPECFMSRIMYLRHLVNTGKINNKEHKQDKEQCSRIGWDIIELNNVNTEKEPDWLF
jgi:hypothetical protein